MRLLSELRSLRALLAWTKAVQQIRIPDDCPSLPAASVEEVFMFENYISAGDSFEKIVLYLSRFGGTDIQDTVRTILRQLLAKNAALKFSWKGSRGLKEAFHKLENTVNLIMSCVKNTCDSATLKDISAVIKWLVGAPDREGGRNHRRVAIGSSSHRSENDQKDGDS
ncbi:uncharacterized protein LOC135371393 [Ornithodoros turicata]|uniref:uncharacterized protein LOC135371393 n=1 Tax=Ornithodoros turicata TaxID=34597 RepID=UPI003139EC5E